jgi:hypothetical protein
MTWPLLFALYSLFGNFKNHPMRYIAKSLELQVGAYVEVSRHSVPSRCNSISTGYACPVTSAEDGANKYVHHSADRPSTDAHWCIARMAVQLGLGVLPEWRSGPGAYHRAGAGVDGPGLAAMMAESYWRSLEAKPDTMVVWSFLSHSSNAWRI